VAPTEKGRAPGCVPVVASRARALRSVLRGLTRTKTASVSSSRGIDEHLYEHANTALKASGGTTTHLIPLSHPSVSPARSAMKKTWRTNNLTYWTTLALLLAAASPGPWGNEDSA